MRRHHQPLCARAHASGQTLTEAQQVPAVTRAGASAGQLFIEMLC
jgi:hypothetical protein